LNNNQFIKNICNFGILEPSHTLAKIHLKALHTNRFHILFALSFTLFINTLSFGQDRPGSGIPITPKPETPKQQTINDSIPNGEDVLIINEKILDSTLTDSTKQKKGLLEGIVSYKAKDYTSFNRKDQKLYLYNEAEIIYQDMQINAGTIVIDYSKNEVYAGRLKDSLGEYSQRPIFKQGESVVEPDSIRFNLDRKKH